MDSGIDLKFAAAQLADVSENELAEISDYNRFFELADADYDFEVADELNKMVAEAVGNMESTVPNQQTEDVSEKSVEPKQDESKPEQKTETAKSDQPTVNAPEKIAAAKKEPKSGTPFTYHFNEKDVVTGGAKTKYSANVEAIKTLRKIESENRYATPEEQSILAKYVGWGGIPQAFTTDRAAEGIGNLGDAAPTGWESEQRQLRELLSPDEYAAARESSEPPIEDEQSDDYDYPDDDEVIINNSIIETSDLPPLTDEKLIFGILKYDRFFKIKREQIAEFFAENTSSTDRAELLKKAFNHDYTEFDIGKSRGGFKTTDNGVVVWEGHYLNRYKESGLSWDLVQSLTAKMIEQGEYLDERRPLVVTNADELIDGDTIRIDGEEWKSCSEVGGVSYRSGVYKIYMVRMTGTSDKPANVRVYKSSA